MRELPKSEQAILDQIDAELEKIDEKLEPFQDLINQKNRLTKVKATLLNERVGSARSGGGGGTHLTHEQVTQAFRDSEQKYMTPKEISDATGANPTTVRSHLNRGKGNMYKKQKDGDGWRLIGETRE